jgi:prephenate dehydrogenase
MRLAILGFGQIGGSVAGALHARVPGAWSVAAWSPSGEGPRRALADGVIETAPATPAYTVDGADAVLLAAPPMACLELLDELAGPLGTRLGDATVVTDVASTKRRIVERARALGLPFVGGHPMAGREATGYGAADVDLFVDRPWVVCEGPDAAMVEHLARDAGARPVRMTAAEHDDAVAAISHLPLVLSVALVEAVSKQHASSLGNADADPRRLAAGGWASMTRLAAGDPAMGAGILATNGDEVARRLRDVRAGIDAWIELLDASDPDPGTIRARLEDARRLLGRDG